MPPIGSSAKHLFQYTAPEILLANSQTYSKTSLLTDLEILCDSKVPISEELIINLILKYFHAYIYPGSHTEVIPLSEITHLFSQFAHRRTSFSSLNSNKALRQILLRYSFALCMLGDLPKSAHIIQLITKVKLNPNLSDYKYLGLDIGTGTGILILAEYIQARRNHFQEIEIVGIEREKNVYERTKQLCQELNLGQIICADAKNPNTYSRFKGRKISFISNETIPGMDYRMWREDFLKINRCLFKSLKQEMQGADFFPQGLLVYARSQDLYLMLTKQNHFQGDSKNSLLTTYARGILSDGYIVPLHQLGDNFKPYFSKQSEDILPRRW